MKKNHRIAPEVKEQILRRIKEEGVPVVEAAKDAGIHPTGIYRWLGKGVTGVPALGEMVRLKRENRELLSLVGELTWRMSQAEKRG
jgi:transposase-like protein